MEAKETRESYKGREQKREDRINKMERQLVKIYEKLLELDTELKDAIEKYRLKEIDEEVERLNNRRKYLENICNNKYNNVEMQMKNFNE